MVADGERRGSGGAVLEVGEPVMAFIYYAGGPCLRCGKAQTTSLNRDEFNRHVFPDIASEDQSFELVRQFSAKLSQYHESHVTRQTRSGIDDKLSGPQTMLGAMIVYLTPPDDELKARRNPPEGKRDKTRAKGPRRHQPEKKRNDVGPPLTIKLLSVSGLGGEYPTHAETAARALGAELVRNDGVVSTDNQGRHRAQDIAGKPFVLNTGNLNGVERNRLGKCAAPKLISAAIDHAKKTSQRIVAMDMSEIFWIGGDVPGGERNKNWSTVTAVPSCNVCEVLLPQMLCTGDPGRKPSDIVDLRVLYHWIPDE
jgi:hypothetical protein